jgi:hypothetical protein
MRLVLRALASPTMGCPGRLGSCRTFSVVYAPPGYDTAPLSPPSAEGEGTIFSQQAVSCQRQVQLDWYVSGHGPGLQISPLPWR